MGVAGEILSDAVESIFLVAYNPKEQRERINFSPSRHVGALKRFRFLVKNALINNKINQSLRSQNVVKRKGNSIKESYPF